MLSIDKLLEQLNPEITRPSEFRYTGMGLSFLDNNGNGLDSSFHFQHRNKVYRVEATYKAFIYYVTIYLADTDTILLKGDLESPYECHTPEFRANFATIQILKYVAGISPCILN